MIGCDDDYVDFYGLDVVAGRGFDDSFGAEETNVLFNESAMRRIGFNTPEELLGKEIQFGGTLSM